MDAPLTSGAFARYTDEYMHRLPLITWARYIFVAGLFIALVGLIPSAWFPLQLGKLALFAVLAFVAGAFFFVGGGGGGIAGKRGTFLSFAVLALPFGYLLSYVFSTDKSVALLGYSLEADTVAFVTLGCLAFLLGSFLFRRSPSVRLLLSSILGAAGIALVFQIISILFGTHVLSQLFADPSTNLVGKWNDLGLLAGLALMLLTIPLASGTLTPVRRIAAALASIVLVVFLALVQFALVWGLLLAFFCVLALMMYLSTEGESRPIPWLPIAGAVISVLLLVWGAVVQGGLTKVFPVSSLEVRPAISTTLDITRASHGSSIERFLVGSGPNTFGSQWSLYRPQEVNLSQFWNLDFNVGYSTLATALATVGLLGALLWLLPLVLVLLGLVRAIRTPSPVAEDMILALSTGFGAAYLWISTFFYVPSQNMLLLAFVLSGAAFAFSMRGEASAPDVQQTSHRMPRLLYIALWCLVVVLLGVIAWAGGRRFMAEMYTNKGLAALGAGDVPGALTSANMALSTERTGDALQFASVAGLAQMQTLINATSTPSTQTQQVFAQTAQTTISIGQEAVLKNPSDYRAYTLLANVYSLLASVGVDGAYDTAKKFYANASAHNPSNPALPLALARLEAAHGNEAATTAALQQSLQLKNDYTDAILFVVQLDVAKKDIPNAIIAAKAAVQSAPGVPSIWFELGLLFYSNNDMKDAALALEQAVALEPNYANAKYFLGLSYANVNRTADAIKQFKDLAATNPDNQEVQLILSNLEAGKKPFDGATPPVTKNPEDRQSAPIGQ